MPRKPSSVFVITQPAGGQVSQAYREPLTETQDLEAILSRHYNNHPVGTEVFVVEDTKVTAYRIGLTIEEIDDARLGQDEDGEGG